MTRWHLKHALYGDKPWAVQEEALRRAEGRPRWGNFLEQGLGKTALDLNEFVDADDVDINVVVAPNSFKVDWVLAPEEWGLGFIPTGMWPKDPLPYDQEIALYSVNYEAVRGETRSSRPGSAFKPLMELFEKRRVKFTIDESFAIKNPGSITTKGVIELAKAAKMVRCLNGTPAPESVIDYYPQLRALGELNGMNPIAFRNRFAKMGGWFNKKAVGRREENEGALARILDRCSFRALKADWRKDLPPKLQVSVHLEMTNKQRHHYQTMMEEFFVMIDGADITAEMVLTQMGKLQQIAGCLIMDKGEVHWIEEPKNNPKVKATLDIIDGGPGKVIVSHMYKPAGEMLYAIFKKHGLEPAWLRGDPEVIRAEKDRFNNDTNCRICLGQQVTMARGHTLIGRTGARDRCNRLIMYENHFGLYWREQIGDRNHRGEQDEECTIYDLITSPMDQVVRDALVEKKEKADTMDRLVLAVRQERNRRE